MHSVVDEDFARSGLGCNNRSLGVFAWASSPLAQDAPPHSDRSVLAARTRLVLRVQLFGKLRRTVANLLTPRPGRARLVRLLGRVVFAAVDAW